MAHETIFYSEQPIAQLLSHERDKDVMGETRDRQSARLSSVFETRAHVPLAPNGPAVTDVLNDPHAPHG